MQCYTCRLYLKIVRLITLFFILILLITAYLSKLLLYVQMEKVSNDDDDSLQLETPSIERLEEMVSERAEMMDDIDKQVTFSN